MAGDPGRAGFDLEQLAADAQRLVESSAAPETEVTFEAEQDRFARFGPDGPTQAGDRERLTVSVRARIPREGGYAEARASAVGADPAGWRKALERSLALAQVAPTDERAVSLGGPVEVELRSGDAETLRHDFGSKADWIQAAVRACREHGLRPAGLAQTGGRARVLVNSAGRVALGSTSQASFALTASGASGSGLGSAARGRVGELDVESAIDRAVSKARAAQSPRDLPPGEYPVLLEPLAVSSALLFSAYCGFGAREVAEGESFLCGREGERVLAPGLTVTDDASAALAPGLAFDAEGSPRRPTPLVENGVLRGPVTDARYARQLGLPCTGHAGAQPSERGPAPENLVVAAGTLGDQELLRGLGAGLLVTQLHYTNLMDPRTLTLTGMTRNGTFWVEDGEVREPVKNLRFTDSLLRFLGSEGVAVGARQDVAGALFNGQVITPALGLPSLRFTSSSDA